VHDWHWRVFDNDLDYAANATDADHPSGLKVILEVIGAPGWAGGNDCISDPEPGETAGCPELDAPGENDGLNHWPDWRNFVSAVVAHAEERHPGELIGVEAWNEPNGRVGGGIDPIVYARLVLHTYNALKPTYPNLTIIMGGLVAGPSDWLDDPPYMGQAEYLANVLYWFINNGYTGTDVKFDAISNHPYPKTAEVPDAWNKTQDKIEELKSWRDVYDTFCSPLCGFHKPIWVTEVGVSSYDAEHPAQGWTKQDEALQNVFNHIDLETKVAICHTLNDNPAVKGVATEIDSPADAFGTRTKTDVAKPSFVTLRDIWP